MYNQIAHNVNKGKLNKVQTDWIDEQPNSTYVNKGKLNKVHTDWIDEQSNSI